MGWRRQSRLRKALWIALAMHSLMAMVLLWTPKARTNVPTQVLLELVSLPSTHEVPKPLENKEVPEQEAQPLPPQVKPIKLPEAQIEALPEIVLPPKPPKAQDKPKPVSKPKPAPAQRMTYEDFLKKHKPQKPAPQTKPAPKPPAQPKLKLEALELPIKTPAASSTKSPAPSPVRKIALQEPSAQALAFLRAHIDSVWQKPALSKPQKTRASFCVTTSGRLEAIELEAPSGHAAFDQSIKTALGRVELPSVASELLGQRFSMTFESQL